MKQFIVLTACLPLILLIMLQIIYEQKDLMRAETIQSIVYQAREEARLSGYFSESLMDSIREELLSVEGVMEANFESDVKEPLERYSLGENRFIDYKISLKIKNVMAGGGFLIGEGKNIYSMVLEGSVASEYLGQAP